MHGYGDYDCVSNKQTVILIEHYLIKDWLGLFTEGGRLNMTLLTKTYKDDLKH
jgi:hypothetical protein